MRDPYPMSKPTRSRRSLAEWWRSWWPWSVIWALRAELALKHDELRRLDAERRDAVALAETFKWALWRDIAGDQPMPEWLRRGVRGDARAHLLRMLREEQAKQNVGGGE